jgi:hypothetical protein
VTHTVVCAFPRHVQPDVAARKAALTFDQLQRLASRLRTAGLGCGVAAASVPAVAGLRDPHLEHDPAGPS